MNKIELTMFELDKKKTIFSKYFELGKFKNTAFIKMKKIDIYIELLDEKQIKPFIKELFEETDVVFVDFNNYFSIKKSKYQRFRISGGDSISVKQLREACLAKGYKEIK